MYFLSTTTQNFALVLLLFRCLQKISSIYVPPYFFLFLFKKYFNVTKLPKKAEDYLENIYVMDKICQMTLNLSIPAL